MDLLNRFTRCRLLVRLGLAAVAVMMGCYAKALAAEGVARAVLGHGDQLRFLLQQIVNAVTVSAVYGLVAVGYTLLYRIIGRINLAFGDFAMMGGVFSYVVLLVLAAQGAYLTPVALILTLVVVCTVGAVYGAVSYPLVFKPLRSADTYAPIVATLGLGIALREVVRVTQGAQTRWLPPLYDDALPLWQGEGYTVTIVPAQLMLIVLVLLAYAVVGWLLHKTPFGLRFRACADDSRMAALCGVSVGRTIAQTLALSTGLSMLAGYIFMVHYGGVDIASGYFVGFKALVAAVLGGIGSVPGAMLGGLVIGLLETFWSAYFSFEYRDIAVFAVLALVLVFRPAGLLGMDARGGR